VDFHVPKLYHNPQVDSEVLKMVLDVNSDILGSNQKVVMKRLLEPSMLPCSLFQDVDLLPILEDVMTFIFAYGQYCIRQMMEYI
jgi:hypothetical protein